VREHFSTTFWAEVAAATATMFLAAITMVWPNWIELVFRFDPDHGNGSLERVVVGVAAALCLTSLLLARREWQRAGLRLAAARSSA